MLYVLKIKGTKIIPDFVQIRDEQMTLRAYFRLSQQEIGLKNLDLKIKILFGKIMKMTILIVKMQKK